MGSLVGSGSPIGSMGNLLGIGPQAPQAPVGNFGNAGLTQLNSQNQFADGTAYGQASQGALGDYANGSMTSQQAVDANSLAGANGAQAEGFSNALATGANTGSKYAAEQLGNNSTQAGLYGPQGQLGQAEGKLTDLQNQGFELKPEDQTLYGQESGNIARQFGQQGNDMANNLASRGLSSSGAAGAGFSGLQGNQNEMLAQAQQQIAQQRFQNTNQQIGQYQNFVNSLGGQYNNALNQQYGRQAQGAQQQEQGLGTAAQLTQGSDNAQNQNAESNFATNQASKPKNFVDMGTGAFAGMTGAAGSGFGKSAGQSAGSSLFGSAG